MYSGVGVESFEGSMLTFPRNVNVLQGCIAFAKISPNVLQECAIIDDVLKPDEDGKLETLYLTMIRDSGFVMNLCVCCIS